MKIMLNNGWEFTEQFTEELLGEGPVEGLRPVRLPHTVKETPFHYFDESVYQMVSGYRRSFFAPESWAGKRVLLSFGAAGHFAQVWCNGSFVGEHRCGYTAFTLELTDALRLGAENRVVVRLDSREDLDQPPFGHVIDYMTYGGLYRDCWLEVREKSFIEDLFARPFLPAELKIPAEPEARDALRFTGRLSPEVKISGPAEGLRLRLRVREQETGTTLDCGDYALGERIVAELPNAQLWDVDRPWLYTLRAELMEGDRVLDAAKCAFGFRRSAFRGDGYYLNDRRLTLRGLNRHQSWPYVGYAMPASQQRLDAEILKRELGLNMVRTSHYPQSQDFVDRCDQLGLLVFTEIPGWQHIGGADWKEQAVRNVEEMVLQYRNHPSVVLWGVRINESQDDDALYERTNAVARRLDPGRPTGGVRFLKQSHLLEDVYTYNDFLHDGTNPGCAKKSEVSPDVTKPYLITECNGHMYPTKAFDDEAQRQEQALRHARVMDAAAAEPGVAGALAWSMSDYNTHRDFGSGDRICYHGVLDMFRNPKLAAALYASQREDAPVLELGSQMEIGEHAASMRGDVWIFTNCDSVRMYRNGSFLREYRASDTAFPHLPHGPILIDDFIGDRMKAEGFAPRQEQIVKDLLNYAARKGMGKLPPRMLARAGAAMAIYGMKFQDAYRLFGKYIGDWGVRSSGFRFEGVKDGKVVVERVCAPMTVPHIEARPSAALLWEGESYDVASVRVAVKGEQGQVLPFWNTPLELELEGPAELIGPANVPIFGGQGGVYLRTTGETGEVLLRLKLPREFSGEAVELRFTVRKRN